MNGKLHKLAEEIERISGGFRAGDGARVSSGLSALDGALGGGGFPRGAIVEYLTERPGAGAGMLALAAAGAACAAGGAVVVFDRRRRFYPPAAAAWGIEPARLVLVAAENEEDQRWAIDQTLRARAVAAVLAWPESRDAKDFRRWQLAAESSGCLALFMRPMAARDEPSWAAVRLGVLPEAIGVSVGRILNPSHVGRLWRVEILKCRGKAACRSVEVFIDDATTCAVPVAAEGVGCERERRARA